MPTRTMRGSLRILLMLLALLLAVSVAGCAADDAASESSDSEAPTSDSEAVVEVEPTRIVLASTTSTQDSGLFDVLIPAFETDNPEFIVDVVAVGTGEALALGESKDADVLLVHAKASEEEFLAGGFGTERRDVMYNDFIVVGPATDPAGIAGGSDAAAALTAISESGATFVSRGDNSGTNKKEISLWESAGIEPSGDWYLSAGQGMGDVLKMASETLGYTMCDRATYLNLKDGLDLEILTEGDPLMFNQYGVIPVTDASNAAGADAFMEWITGDGQAIIKTYGEEKFGQPLFIPNA